MTENEWLACTDPTPMLTFLKHKATDRKLRLFQVACCRRIWHLMPDTHWREAVTVAEQYADGEVGDKRRKAVLTQMGHPEKRGSQMEKMAVFAAELANRRMHRNRVALGCADVIGFAARKAMGIIDAGPCRLDDLSDYQHERAVEASLIRDIFRNSFRPVTVDPAWLTSDVVALATGIYADHDFSAMPILADALQDASCDNEDILNHCREPGEHVRGCWVVDAILGKS